MEDLRSWHNDSSTVLHCTVDCTTIVQYARPKIPTSTVLIDRIPDPSERVIWSVGSKSGGSAGRIAKVS